MSAKNKSSKEKEKPYTVEEFFDHVRALPIVRKYEHISRPFGNAQHVEVGDDQSFEIHALRVMDYFSQVYANADETREKSVLFVVMMTHIAKYKDAYDSEKFAVFSDDMNEASMLSVHLLRAVHHHFTSAPLGKLPKEDALVEAIKITARKIAEEDSKSTH
jgi:hypothetical protein